MQVNDQNSLFQPFQQDKFGLEDKRILGQTLSESLEPGCSEYAAKFASLLRDVTFERRKGNRVFHVKQLSQTSKTEQPFHVLQYAAYLSSNNLLGALRTDKLLCWILDRGNFWAVEALLALATPTTSTFASALFNSAVRVGKSDIAGTLLRKEVNPNMIAANFRRDSYSTLDEAVSTRNTTLTRLLVKIGAEARVLSWEKILLHKYNERSDKNYWENVQFVIDNSENIDKEFGWPARTLLDNVIEQGDPKAVKMVLKAGARVNKIRRCSATPLQAAAAYGNVEIVKLLLEAGANVNALIGASNTDTLDEGLKRDYAFFFLTPLQISPAEDQNAAAEILLQHGADVNGFDASVYCNAWTAAMVKAEQFSSCSDETTARLEDPPVWRDHPWEGYGEWPEAGMLDSPLQAAARKGDLALAHRLLSLGENIDARGSFGTALQVAASMKGNLELVKFLLGEGADINTPAYDPVGQTALQAAIKYSDMETIHFLLESGAGVNAETCLAHGCTALQAAVRRNDVILAKLL